MKKSITWLLAGGALIGQSAAYAVGLGAIEVRSGLNEPLNAEISLNASAADVTALSVALASAEEFARVGIDPGRVGVPLEFAVARNARGEPIIRVTSAQPVREPFLSFLIDVNWPAGRLLREYTVLLDPPVMAPAVRGSGITAAPVRDTAAPTVPAELPAAEPPSRPMPPPAAAPARPAAAAPAPAPAAARSGDYGPVSAGETAWDIARAVRPDDSVSIHQMMLALLQANPQAFVDGNINALRRGVILRIPTAEEARALSQAQAIAEVRAQNDAWRGRSGRAPALLADGAAATAPAASRPAAATRDDARLELVPPRAGQEGGSTTGTADAELRSDLARTREELASSRQESRELQGRVRELEALRDNQERMINIKSGELEAVQAQLREAREQLAALEAARVAAGEAVASLPAVPSLPDDDLWGVEADPIDEPEVLGEDAETVLDEDLAAVEDELDNAIAAVDGEDGAASDSSDDQLFAERDAVAAIIERPVADPAPVDAPVAAVSERPLVAPAALAPPPAPTPVWQQPWVLGGAGLLVALLAGLGIARRRKPAAAEGGGSLGARMAAGSGAAGALAVDAVDDQEEARLIAAIDAEPDSAELRLELLSLYFSRGDRERFESAAEAMYGQITDPGQHEWQEVVAMGKSLCPDNDLFVSSEELGFPGLDEFPEDTATIDRLAEQAEEAFGESFASAEPEAPVSPADGSANDDLDDLFSFDRAFDEVAPDQTAQTRLVEPVSETASAPELEALEFDFDTEVGAADSAGGRSEISDYDLEASASADLGDALGAEAGLDELDLESDLLGGEDAVGTKLDLAKAYLDMGDPEGARSMLEEVIAEGSDAQRREAERLIAEI